MILKQNTGTIAAAIGLVSLTTLLFTLRPPSQDATKPSPKVSPLAGVLPTLPESKALPKSKALSSPTIATPKPTITAQSPLLSIPNPIPTQPLNPISNPIASDSSIEPSPAPLTIQAPEILAQPQPSPAPEILALKPTGSMQVKVHRWLEVTQMTRNVTYQNSQSDRPAQIGDRLTATGDRLATGVKSQATLDLDNGLGLVNVNASTTVKIQELKILPSGGRIAQLKIDGGQVRLKVRSFKNPDSRLELITPAGVSGVRGTEFGVSVHPNGNMSAATLTGKVATTAQGQEVMVTAGFQNLTIKGEAPLPATPLTNDTRLTLEELQLEGSVIHLVGRVDAVNLLEIDAQPIATDRTGHFDVKLPVKDNYQLTSIVTTPLGIQQIYELAIP